MRDKSQQALQASKYPWLVYQVLLTAAAWGVDCGGTKISKLGCGEQSQRRQPPLFGSGSPAWVSGSAFPSKSGCGHGSPLVSVPLCL